MPSDDFGSVLAEAVEVLRGLPRRRDGVTEARRSVEAFAAGHEHLAPALVVDQPPDGLRADFDLILSCPDGGNVAINYQPDDGRPWAVDHASHWAANRVVTVGDQSLSVPAALMALRARGLQDLGALEQLVDHCILLEAAASDEEAVAPAELQRASDAFRRRRGLLTRAAMLEWLDSIGLPLAEFERHIETTFRIARIRRRVAQARAAGHLAVHPRDFERVTAHWIEVPTRASADLAASAPDIASAAALLAEAKETSFLELRGARLACQLPDALRDADVGQRCGPCPTGPGFLLGTVLERQEPEQDDVTLKAAGEAAVRAWLAERRSEADIHWHWL
jgi:putative peptide maturation system protein